VVRKNRAESLFHNTGVKDEDGIPIFVSAASVPVFFTEEFWEAYEFYAACELLGEIGAQPFSGGWATWPEVALKTLLAFRAESSRCDEEEMKAASGGR